VRGRSKISFPFELLFCSFGLMFNLFSNDISPCFQPEQQQMQDVVERESVATGITVEVEELQKRNRDAFCIPEWFLYTSRAFLTLEGVR